MDFGTCSFLGTTREQLLDIPPQQCYILDNAPVNVDVVVYLGIFDVKLARYTVDQLFVASSCDDVLILFSRDTHMPEPKI